jgi:O-antigen/teichoic acid export membrane protein
MNADGPTGIVRNVVALTAMQAVGWIGAAALTVVLPRYLGDSDLGKFAFAFAFTRLAGLIAELGTTTYIAREIARAAGRATGLASNAVAMRVPLAVVATVAAVGAARVMNTDPTTQVVVDVFAAGIVIDAVLSVVTGSLQGLGLMRKFAQVQLVAKLAFSGLAIVALVGFHAGPAAIAAVWVVGQALGAGLGGLALLRRRTFQRRLEPRTWPALLRGGLPFLTWQAALLVYGQVDAVLLALLTRDAVVGWYSAAYRIVSIPIFLPAIIMTVVFPVLSAQSAGSERFRSVATGAARATIALTVPLALGLMLLSDRVIDLLGYPVDFKHSIPVMIIVAAGLPLVAVDMLIGTMLNASDRQRPWAMTAIAAAIMNPVANLLAIPLTERVYGNGAIGAAAVTTGTEVFMMAVGLALLPARSFAPETLRYAIRAVACGALMTVAVLAIRELPLPIVIAAGGLVYAVAAFSLRLIHAGDVRSIVQAARQRAITPAAVASVS